MKKYWIAFMFLSLVSCGKKEAENLTYRVVSERPHDTASYTQGLEFRNGMLLESSGQYGSSSIRITDPTTGAVIHKRPVAANVFAEGITVLNNELWVLSWKEGIATVLDAEKLSFLRSHHYAGEGWGLTNNGRELIMSDGSNALKFLDPKTFAVRRTVEVRDGGAPVNMLNELEYADGAVWANLWQSGKIARIDPADGRVTGWLDLAGLRGHLAGKGGRPEVMNGIARDPATGHFFVTGKNWPLMFELEVKGQ